MFVVLVTGGACLTVHPVAQTLTADRRTARVVAEHARATAREPASRLAADLESARRYNATLPARLLTDPWGTTLGRVDGPDHDTYLRTLARTDVMARLRIRSIGVDLPVRHDSDDASLRVGVGHMYGTALPVGGPGTHAVLAGHTGWRGATFFDRLGELGAGDVVTVDVAGRTLTYRVTGRDVVPAWRVDAVRPVAGRDLLTLVTCITPPGEGKQRLLVRGERVADAVGAAAPDVTGDLTSLPAVQRWMWPRLGVGAAALIVVAVAVAAWAIGGHGSTRGRRR